MFLEGLTETLKPFVEAIGELAAALPTPFSADDAAATHHHLFAFQLFPYESFFRAESGLSGGAIAGEVAHLYQQAGFDAAADSPDHLGHELAYLAHLAQAEAHAWEKQQPHRVDHWQQQQHQFLQEHLLTWLAPLVVGLHQASPGSFYDALAQLMMALVADHAAALPLTLNSHPLSLLPSILPALSENPRPWEFVHFWLTPALSGLFLSRDEIGRVARQAGVVQGFGKRDELLKNVLDGSAAADTLPALFHSLRQLSQQWHTAYHQLATTFPTLLPFIAPWQKRVQQAGEWEMGSEQ